MVELDPIAGESAKHDLEQLRQRREQEVAFVLAKRTLDRFFRDGEGAERPWLFGDLLRITKEWLATCVTCKDNACPADAADQRPRDGRQPTRSTSPSPTAPPVRSG